MLPDSFTSKYLRQIELLKLRTRRAFLGTRQGSHISSKRGHGLEFSDYRKYEPGDSPRHIDWGLYARSDRLYVKTFREEQDLSLLIILDISASMSVEQIKWEASRDLALTLAYIALMGQDRVCLAVINESELQHITTFMSGAHAIHTFAALLAKQPKLEGSRLKKTKQQAGERGFFKAVSQAAQRLKIPGKAILISDLLIAELELRDTLDWLRSRNLEISLLQVLTPSDLDPASGLNEALFIDSENGQEIEISLDQAARAEYSQIFKDHQKQIENYCHSASISINRFIANDSLIDFVLSDLTKAGLVQ